MGSGSIKAHQRTARMRIDGTIGSSNLQEHQIAAVIELNREPIPAGLAGLEKVAAELMVHPRKSGNIIRLAVDLDSARCFEPGKRIVVGSISVRTGLLTDSAFVVYHLRFQWCEAQGNGEVSSACRQCMKASI